MAGFFLPFEIVSIGSKTLMVVEIPDILAEHTRCLPIQTPALKKLAWFWIFFGLFNIGDTLSGESRTSKGYDIRLLVASTSRSWYSSKTSI